MYVHPHRSVAEFDLSPPIRHPWSNIIIDHHFHRISTNSRTSSPFICAIPHIHRLFPFLDPYCTSHLVLALWSTHRTTFRFQEYLTILSNKPPVLASMYNTVFHILSAGVRERLLWEGTEIGRLKSQMEDKWQGRLAMMSYLSIWAIRSQRQENEFILHLQSQCHWHSQCNRFHLCSSNCWYRDHSGCTLRVPFMGFVLICRSGCKFRRTGCNASVSGYTITGEYPTVTLVQAPL